MRQWTKTKTVKLSVCSCGFPSLKDEIPLGKEYEVDINHITPGFNYTCGGCGMSFMIEGIPAKEGTDDLGWLPVGLFDL